MGNHDRKNVAWMLLAVLAVVAVFVYVISRHRVEPAGDEPASVAASTSTRLPGRDVTAHEGARLVQSSDSVRGSEKDVTAPVRMSYADIVVAHDGLGLVAIDDVALSPEELHWLDEHGSPAKSVRKEYVKMSDDELLRRASEGDTNAALVGADKFFMEALAGLSVEKRHELMGDDPESSKLALEELVSSDAWKEQRKLLWQAAIRGSAHAAKRMAGTFQNPGEGDCFDELQCDAWLMVAWRMGDWSILSSGGYVNRPPPLMMSLDVASRLWNEINRKRAELGLPPMQIDLRPNHDLWLDLQKNPNRPVDVYQRR